MKVLGVLLAILLAGQPTTIEAPGVDQSDYIKLLEQENKVLRETLNSTGFNEIESKINLNVCDINATFKSYMDYRKITDTTSPHFELVNDAKVNPYGHLIYQGRIVVAMANQYGDVGQKLDITLSTGNKLHVVLGDIKSVPCAHQDGSMLEFIVDSTKISERLRTIGNYNEVYPGTITKIEGGY